MSRVFWDTNLFVYLFEDRGKWSEMVVALRKRMIERGDVLYTSAFTLGEILVKPLEEKDDRLRRQYEDVLMQVAQITPFDLEAAKLYAQIRQDRSLRAPDAIQLACAARERVDLFLTNDERLTRKTISGIQFIASLERSPI